MKSLAGIWGFVTTFLQSSQLMDSLFPQFLDIGRFAINKTFLKDMALRQYGHRLIMI